MSTEVGPGLKYDDGKLAIDLIPVRAHLEVGKVVTFGAKKYGPNNWQNVRPVRRYFAAALRHLYARALGEKTDPESGLPHLAHAACCVLFMLSIELGVDDADAFEPAEEKGYSVVRPVKVGSRARILAKCQGFGKEGTVIRATRASGEWEVETENDGIFYLTEKELWVLP